MTPVFSGGIVYMFFEEANDYGLVNISADGTVTKLKDFGTLQTQVLKADPQGVDINDYNPTNKPASCPPLTVDWQAAEALPPTPDASLCSCMQSSLSCVRANNLNPDDYGAIFGFICGKSPAACAGINGNTTTGVYGAYVMCDDGAKLDYVLNAYYDEQDQVASACDFDGEAQVVTPKSTSSSCSSALASASAANQVAATATSAVEGSSSTSVGSAKTSNPAIPGAPMAHLFSVGELSIGVYMVVAMLVGASMMAL